MSAMRGQNTRGRAIPAGFCNTPSVVGPQYCNRASITDAPPLTIPGPGTSGAVTQVVTAERDPPQFLDSSFVKTPAMTDSFPAAATSHMKLGPKHMPPPLACVKTEERLQTTPSKTTSVPGAAATMTKSKLVNGKPLRIPPTFPLDSAASQVSRAVLTIPQRRQLEPTYPLQNWDNSPEKWTVDEVAQYISGIPGCENMAEKFRHHEIDGGALFLIKEHHLMMAMDVRLGPALKVCAAIGALHRVCQDNQTFGARRNIAENRRSTCFI